MISPSGSSDSNASSVGLDKINLSTFKTQNGDYHATFALLGKVDGNYPLVKVEQAKIHLALNQLDSAEKLLTKLLASLDTKNGESWYFKTDKQAIVLGNLSDKKCYIAHLLTAVLHLQNKNVAAAASLKTAAKSCGANEEPIKQQVQFDLESK